MKRLKIALGVIAFALGMTLSSFTSERVHHATLSDPFWYHASDFSASGYIDQASLSAEVNEGVCPNTGSTLCEAAFDGSQLNVANDPSSGVKTGQSPVATINERP